jgi:spore coat polysaccharide biosynthesis predicted glycosyltransferase SpsG
MSKSEYDATIQEWVDYQLSLIAQEKTKIENAQAKALLLERLGITADEAKLLLA